MSKLSERVARLERKVELLMNHSHKNGGINAELYSAEYVSEEAYNSGKKKGRKLAQATQETSEAV